MLLEALKIDEYHEDGFNVIKYRVNGKYKATLCIYTGIHSNCVYPDRFSVAFDGIKNISIIDGKFIPTSNGKASARKQG